MQAWDIWKNDLVMDQFNSQDNDRLVKKITMCFQGWRRHPGNCLFFSAIIQVNIEVDWHKTRFDVTLCNWLWRPVMELKCGISPRIQQRTERSWFVKFILTSLSFFFLHFTYWGIFWAKPTIIVNVRIRGPLILKVGDVRKPEVALVVVAQCRQPKEEIPGCLCDAAGWWLLSGS